MNTEVVLSLAGRTAQPVQYPVPTRIGGFGGPSGLARYLLERRIGLLIDATHPFAAQISRNAAKAAAETGLPFFKLLRPAWERREGDRWIEAASVPEAVARLGPAARRVFVTLGRQELAPLISAPHHSYLVRSVDPVDPPLDLPDARYLNARGPFGLDDERELLVRERIDIVLAKNSGGEATYAKIVAARQLGIEVAIVRRPEHRDVPTVATAAEGVRLAHQLLASAA